MVMRSVDAPLAVVGLLLVVDITFVVGLIVGIVQFFPDRTRNDG